MFCGNRFKCDNCYDVCPDKTPLPNWGRISVLSSNMINVSDVVYMCYGLQLQCHPNVSREYLKLMGMRNGSPLFLKKTND